MRLRTIMALAVFLTASLHSETQLWEMSFESVVSAYWRVGSDGSVAIVLTRPPEAPQPESEILPRGNEIHWIGRDGAKLADIEAKNFSVWEAIYVSQDELVLWSEDEGGQSSLELFQFGADRDLEERMIPGKGEGMVTSHSLSYPYLLSAEVTENEEGLENIQLRLIDLTSETSLDIVGDAVISSTRWLMVVRWKSVVNAKYRVQISYDAVNWVNHTEILDGTGSQIVVTIPLKEEDVEILARVVKL